jgi:hypothetical protein
MCQAGNNGKWNNREMTKALEQAMQNTILYPILYQTFYHITSCNKKAKCSFYLSIVILQDVQIQ